MPEPDVDKLRFAALAPGGDLSAVAFETEYRSLKDDPVQRFYVKCLREACHYQRAVGYFRSTVFAVVGIPIIEFARRGGKIDLICSPDLKASDIEQIADGHRRREDVVSENLIHQFDALLSDPRSEFAARTLATLIATGILEMKLAERRDRSGIYHEKIGIFSDQHGNRVSFRGSTNETWSGWHDQGNFESIEVFCSWREGTDPTRVAKHSAHFESLWSEEDPHIEVTPMPTTAEEYFRKYAAPHLDDLSFDERAVAPRRKLMPHQSNAIEAWEAQGRRGIFEHATGSGKTFTAINIIKSHVARDEPAIVLVPSQLLLKQWAKEISEEIPDAALLLAGAGHDPWKRTRRLRSMTADDKDLGPRIVLAMMPTAASDQFRRDLSEGPHLLVVADEVHQIGSTENSRFLETNTGSRLGLSATPKRYGDPDGTMRIFNYFGPIVQPPISLRDAVNAGRLVQYEYHPHPIHLTASEAEQWTKESRAIQLEVARSPKNKDGSVTLSQRARQLLINRSRIAKKAEAKTRLALTVIQEEFEAGQSWLIYCEDSDQLSGVLEQLREHDFSPIEYHSSMEGAKSETMEWFKAYGGILVSIRCLDEGVDIPSVSHALILASSQNPRQFIQRRGRVLRQAPGKSLAVIHDAIVVPVDLDSEQDQLGLLKAEMVRAVEFAGDAFNRMAAAKLREIAIAMGFDPDELSKVEGEEEDDVGGQ